MTNPLTPAVLPDPVELTRVLVDIESVSLHEKDIADCVEQVLRAAPHLRVERFGNTVMARTDLGRPQRVVLAGHLDTVPIADNVPARFDGEIMYGCGTSDMKSGVALALQLAVALPEPRYDLTYFFYEAEEIDSAYNGLNLVSKSHPEWLAADFAVLLEPTHGVVEAGCQGTMRVLVSTTGERAHSARSWRGVNAIHAAAGVLDRLADYEAAAGDHRRLRLPRGAQRGADQRRHRRQRDPGPVRDRDQLPVRAGPVGAGGGGCTSASCSRGTR